MPFFDMRGASSPHAAIACCACLVAASLPWAKPGDHRFFHGGYVEFIEGDLPLIVSAPHGGALLPTEFAPRVADTAKALSDQNTEELALELVAEAWKSGHGPYAVINHVHRLKLDPNRDS